MAPTRFLTTREAADRRRRTPQALVMERKRGTGPPYVIDGGRYLYPEADLDAWLEARRIDPSITRRSRAKRSLVKKTEAPTTS